MKRLLLTIGIVCLLGACKNGDMENENTINKPIGVWENSTNTSIETFQFTDTAIVSTYKSLDPPLDPVTVNGTYQCYDTVIIFRMGSGLKFFADYSINGNQLTMTFSHNGNTVIYTKK